MAAAHRAGRRHLATADGVLAIDEVRVIGAGRHDADAASPGRAGHEVLADPELQRDGTLYRIRFHRDGDDPRMRLREDDELSTPRWRN